MSVAHVASPTLTDLKPTLALADNNVIRKEGQRDSSGMSFLVTDDLRQHDMGLVIVGNFGFTLPPGQEDVKVPITHCPTECTRRMKTPVTMTHVILHQHWTGVCQAPFQAEHGRVSAAGPGGLPLWVSGKRHLDQSVARGSVATIHDVHVGPQNPWPPSPEGVSVLFMHLAAHSIWLLTGKSIKMRHVRNGTELRPLRELPVFGELGWRLVSFGRVLQLFVHAVSCGLANSAAQCLTTQMCLSYACRFQLPRVHGSPS